MISAKFVPLKYYTLSSQLQRLTSFSVGCSGRRILSPGQIAVMRKWSIDLVLNFHLQSLQVYTACSHTVRCRTCTLQQKSKVVDLLKGCGMGTLFVLIFPCFMENVVVTCKIGSFLFSLDNLLQKNVIVFFLNQISK